MFLKIYEIINPGINLFGYISFRAVFAFISALIISFFIGPKVIRTLKNHLIGEEIRQNGPESHLKKEGTPTMGGMIILLSVILPTVLWSNIENIYIQIVLIATSFMGLIGLLDDYLKVVKKYSKGLIARYKILSQILLGLFVAFVLIQNSDSRILIDKIDPPEKFREFVDREFYISSTEISIPFMPDKRLSSIDSINEKIDNNEKLDLKIPSGSIEVGLFIIIICIFVISGSSNSINLTDGIDGLAAGLSAIVFFTLGIIAYASGHYNFSEYLNITYIQGAGEVTIFCFSMVGACLGFLWYNAHPAQVFMGDTGSLSLGAAMGTIAIILKKEILLVIIGGVFVVEALSVILQVSFFKYSKKKYGKGVRFFLMAPLHHHYELKGLNESKIVIRFWIVGILLSLLAIITLKVQ
tara:strand:+ start:3720 stop:4952 length:1233 start_codon:yes stop_codon:yes gene_type:complete